MRLSYRAAILFGALILLSAGDRFYNARSTPSYQPPNRVIENRLEINIGEPNIHLDTPLIIDEDCLTDNISDYLQKINEPLITFMTDDGRIRGFYISEPEKYREDLIELAETCTE